VDIYYPTNSNSLLAKLSDNSNNTVVLSMGATDTSVWNHYALVRNNHNIITYRNGVQVASQYAVMNLSNSSGNVVIGGNATTGPNRSINAYIDDMRVTKASRYTSNFTSPVFQLVNAGPPVTPSNTATPTNTPTITATPTLTPTSGFVPSATPTNTLTPTPSPSVPPAIQTLTFNTLTVGCDPRWQIGNIPANTATLRLTAAGSHRGGVFNNVVFTFPINTNSTQTLSGPTNTSFNLNILHYGASLPGGSAVGAAIPGYFSSITRLNATAFNLEHNFTANVEALDANSNVIGIINGTVWIKDDCDD
jgi:hypothetical protein